jgi:hypothetical protein
MDNNSYNIFGPGTCKGTLNGKPYDGPVYIQLDGRMNRPMSCELGFSGTVPAVITFGSDPDRVDATQIGVVFNAPRVQGVQPLEISGAYNGKGYGLVNWLVPQEDQRETIESCAFGPGISKLPFSAETHTVTPLYG